MSGSLGILIRDISDIFLNSSMINIIKRSLRCVSFRVLTIGVVLMVVSYDLLLSEKARANVMSRECFTLRKLTSLSHLVELSYTLRFVSLTDLDGLCQFGL